MWWCYRHSLGRRDENWCVHCSCGILMGNLMGCGFGRLVKCLRWNSHWLRTLWGSVPRSDKVDLGPWLSICYVWIKFYKKRWGLVGTFGISWEISLVCPQPFCHYRQPFYGFRRGHRECATILLSAREVANEISCRLRAKELFNEFLGWVAEVTMIH